MKRTWMGYKFKKVNSKGLNAYEIIGWVDNSESILPNDENERLAIGTIIIFSTKAWNKKCREEKMVNKEKLYNLLKNNEY